MRSILEELFYGNICPNTDCRSHDKETKQLMGYIADHHDNLLSTLNDQQKELLEKYAYDYDALVDALWEESFISDKSKVEAFLAEAIIQNLKAVAVKYVMTAQVWFLVVIYMQD